jgi:hypothetical protein
MFENSTEDQIWDDNQKVTGGQEISRKEDIMVHWSRIYVKY